MSIEPVINQYGDMIWMKNRWCFHRIDGPAIIRTDGTQLWFINGKLHREDEPAIISPDGSEMWWVNGKRHREDGPAVIRTDGSQEWWINGFIFNDEVTQWMKQHNVNWPWDEETQVQFTLTFS